MNLFSPHLIGPAWGLSELFLYWFKRSKAGSTSRDRNSLYLIWAVNLTAIALGVWLAYHARSWWLPDWLPARAMGGGLFVAGLILRWHAIIYLGRFFTVNVAIADDHQVIQTGPYRWVRHPSYSGALLMVLGFCLCLGNLATLLAIVVPCTGVILWRIHIEEAALTQALGEPYRAYMRRTRRLIPFIY